MRIGVNCLNFDANYAGGVATYIFGLLDAFARVAKDEQFVIIAHKGNAHIFDKYKQYPNFTVKVVDGYNATWKNKMLWQAVKLKAKWLYGFMHRYFYSKLSDELDEAVDIHYHPNTILFPIHQKKPIVLSMHDIQQVHFPEFFKPEMLKDMYCTYNLSAENLDYLQATSEHMKDDFLSYFKTLKPEQVVKIPEGVDIPLFRDQGDVNYLTEKYNIPDGFLYFPAQLWHHKNHITVLKALRKLRDEDSITIPLVLTGASYSASQFIFDYIAEHKLTNVYYLGKVPYADVVALFKKACFLITAVIYESSSIPVLEAAAAGTPSIVSDTRPNRELAERLELNRFETLDENALADLLKKIWNDQTLIDSQTKHNNEAINYYTWDNAANMYLELFHKIEKENK